MTLFAGEHALVRVGIDVVKVDDIAESIRVFGDRYLKRVYTAQERVINRDNSVLRARSLAGRFAAKEATIKILRPAGPMLDWRAIGVVSRDDGSLMLELTGAAAELAWHRAIVDLSVSISHERDVAVAVVAGTVAVPGAQDARQRTA